MMIRRSSFFLAPILTGATLLGASGCVSSIEPDVTLQTTPQDDDDYAPILARATRTRTVFKDFETRISLSATYLSPEFRSAFTRRLERIYKSAPTQFDEAQTKAGFFISIDAPVEDRTDLGNPHHWSILLSNGSGTSQKPILIKKLDDKERWRPFFDTVNEWSTEYLVIFDAPSVTPDAKELVAKPEVISVSFANADAQVNLAW